MTPAPRIRIIGDGRAGGSFAGALTASGWSVELLGRQVVGASETVDIVLLCVPDASVGDVAGSLRVEADTAVLHCSGALGLDVLGDHERVGSVHPLVALADPVSGAARLRGAWFAVAGDVAASLVATELDGRIVHVAEQDRVIYHAAAVVASNHLVALMGQVERLADSIDVPLEAYLDLARGALDDVGRAGPRAALTGPVARGDVDTIAAHLSALPDEEREAYRALSRAAEQLVDRER